MDTMQLVSRFYALLGECSPRDFEKAAEAVGRDTHLGGVLMSLSKYRRQFLDRGADVIVERILRGANKSTEGTSNQPTLFQLKDAGELGGNGTILETRL